MVRSNYFRVSLQLAESIGQGVPGGVELRFVLARGVFHAVVSEILADLIHRVLYSLDFLEVVDLLVAHLGGQPVFQNGAGLTRYAREGVGAGRLGRHRLHAGVALRVQMSHAELLVADVSDDVAALVAELAEDLRHLLIVAYGLPKRSNF